MRNNKVVYRHSTPCGRVFYIGMGSEDRAHDKYSRNIFWKRIKRKYGGFNVEILARDLSTEQAYELEELLISEYGRRDNGTGILCNLDDGGAGVKGQIIKEKQKKKTSKRFSKKVINTETKEILDSATQLLKKYKIYFNSLRKKSPSSDWMYLEDYNSGKAETFEWKNRYSKITNKNYNPIINVKTKKIYDTIQEIDICVCYNYFCQQLKGSRKNTTDYMYLKDYEKGKHLTEKWKNRHKKVIKPKKKRIYRVYDNKKETVIFGTKDELSAKTKVNLSGLTSNNSRDNGRYIILESAYDNKQFHRWKDILDKETNKIERFNQAHLAKHLGVKSNNLSNFFSGKQKVLYGRYIMVFYNPIKKIYE